MAYFLSRCFEAVPEGGVAPPLRPLAQLVFVIALTTTASVVGEVAEFASDAVFGTSAQLGLEDTLLDMALGMIGGASYAVLGWRQGALGVVASLRAEHSR